MEALVTSIVLVAIVRLSFIGFGLWALHSDALDDSPHLHKASVFVLTIWNPFTTAS